MIPKGNTIITLEQPEDTELEPPMVRALEPTHTHNHLVLA